MTAHPQKKPKRLKIIHLLRPHWGALSLALMAVVIVGAADLLEPWPLKLVFDNVLSSKQMPEWLSGFIIWTLGSGKLAILSFAALAVIAIAMLDAISSYTENYLTSSVGQWVMHDLRRMVYQHIQ